MVFVSTTLYPDTVHINCLRRRYSQVDFRGLNDRCSIFYLTLESPSLQLDLVVLFHPWFPKPTCAARVTPERRLSIYAEIFHLHSFRSLPAVPISIYISILYRRVALQQC